MLTTDTDTLQQATRAALRLTPTPQQEQVIAALADFAINRQPTDALVIDGHAGTGKTSVLGAWVEALKMFKANPVVLAPTGRAAKVASRFSHGKAQTIHKHIYRGNALEGNSDSFYLAENKLKDTIFIIDEASMVTDYASGGRSVLADLIRHVYSAPGCALVFIGDSAQLPPIGQPNSPALNTEALAKYGLTPKVLTMTEIVRHAAGSGILTNATRMRQALAQASTTPPPLVVSNFADVLPISSADLEDFITTSWAQVGMDETLIITRSNWRANSYNLGLRGRVLYCEEPLTRSEKLIIAKNNYFWTREQKNGDFLANGETVTVQWVGKPEKKYGRYFVDVELTRQDSDEPLAAKIILRSLQSEGPSLPNEEMRAFADRVTAECDGTITQKMKLLDDDPYFNALQVKYAYCVTCHKAQGGQWKHVYIDMAGIDLENITSDFYRWLYTALTRATEKVFFINPTLPLI